MKKIILVALSFFVYSTSQAQLLHEIGFYVAGTNYSGDIGNELYIFPNEIGGGISYKRNFNTRLSARLSLSYIPLSDADSRAFNEVRNLRDYTFENVVMQAAVGMEFNFFDYDVLRKEMGQTPYLFLSVALAQWDEFNKFEDGEAKYDSTIANLIPFGIGYKSRITDHLGFAAELRVHYTFSDDIEKKSYLGENFGDPTSKDWYFFTGAALTYSFGRPPCFAPRF